MNYVKKKTIYKLYNNDLDEKNFNKTIKYIFLLYNYKKII